MILYHYCSNAAFLSIISTRTLWASEFTLSNDLLEGKWIRNAVEAVIDQKQLESFYKSALLDKLDSIIAFLGAAGICLSEEGDLLSQWRAYSENGSGVSIGFDRQYFGDGGPLPTLQKIEYDAERQKAAIAPGMQRIFDLVEAGALFSPTLLSSAGRSEVEEEYEVNSRKLDVELFGLFPHLYTFKNPAFREEKEWRSITVVIPPTKLGNAVEDGPGLHLHRMNFRPLSDRVVPYIAIALPKDTPSITEVVLGPRNITPLRVMESALLRHGWNNVSVRKSDASYR